MRYTRTWKEVLPPPVDGVVQGVEDLDEDLLIYTIENPYTDINAFFLFFFAKISTFFEKVCLGFGVN